MADVERRIVDLGPDQWEKVAKRFTRTEQAKKRAMDAAEKYADESDAFVDLLEALTGAEATNVHIDVNRKVLVVEEGEDDGDSV